MQLSGLFIRIVFLLVPGILGSKLYRKLRGRVQKKLWEDLAEVILFASLCYLASAFLVQIPSIGSLMQDPAQARLLAPSSQPTSRSSSSNPARLSAFHAFFDEKVPMNPREIVLASVVSVFLAVFAGYVHNHRLVLVLAQLIRASNRTGDEDLWDYFQNSPVTSETYVFVRDHQRGVVYHGFIQAFSDSREERELILGAVTVYTDDSFERLYDTDHLYLSRPRHALTIEVPPSDDNKEIANETHDSGHHDQGRNESRAEAIEADTEAGPVETSEEKNGLKTQDEQTT